MTPKPQPPRPEDESERAGPAAAPQADASPSHDDRDLNDPAAAAETPLIDRGSGDSLGPTGGSTASVGAALQRRGRDDEALAEALRPLVTDALLVSVRRDPPVLVDALFPIILPAIRRAVAGMLRGLVQSLNQILEQSLTVRGFRWRLEAWRTGRPVGEIALRDSLVYRVEQALLIHAENGILLQSVGDEAAADPELMSALLTAIRDFGRESFGDGGEGDFPELPAGGGRQVLVEQGPQAVVAVIVRGTPAAKLRESMQESLGEIQRWYSAQLIDFDGDTSQFEACKIYLEQCLDSEYRQQKQSLTPAYIFLGVAAVVIFAVAVLILWPRWKWGKYIERLRAEPGIAVIDEGRWGGKFRAEILRDPLAADPVPLLYESGMDRDDVDLQIEPILSFHSSMIIKRAEIALGPPDGVRLEAGHGKLFAIGAAPHNWIAQFRARSTTIPGVVEFDDSMLEDSTIKFLRELVPQIEEKAVEFQVADEMIGPEYEGTIAAWAEELDLLARSVDYLDGYTAAKAHVKIIGQTDDSGSRNANLRLSQRRAIRVAEALESRGTRIGEYEVVGIGENEIVGDDRSGTPGAFRRVVIRVHFEPDLPETKSIQ